MHVFPVIFFFSNNSISISKLTIENILFLDHILFFFFFLFAWTNTKWQFSLIISSLVLLAITFVILVSFVEKQFNGYTQRFFWHEWSSWWTINTYTNVLFFTAWWPWSTLVDYLQICFFLLLLVILYVSLYVQREQRNDCRIKSICLIVIFFFKVL